MNIFARRPVLSRLGVLVATSVLLAEALAQVPVAAAADQTDVTEKARPVGTGNSGRAAETTPTRIKDATVVTGGGDPGRITDPSVRLSPEVEAERAPLVRTELVDQRTRSTRTFANSDGTFELTGGTEPIHYLERRAPGSRSTSCS